MVVGRDGHRARELLITRDLPRRIGTRREIGAHYRCQHEVSKVRLIRRRAILFAQLLIVDQDPADMRKAFVPRGWNGDGSGDKPSRMRWRIWWRKIRGLNHRLDPGLMLVPVQRPCGVYTVRFLRLLDRLNAHHIRSGRFYPLSADENKPEPQRRASRRASGQHKRPSSATSATSATNGNITDPTADPYGDRVTAFMRQIGLVKTQTH
jgi:hypothetical protein